MILICWSKTATLFCSFFSSAISLFSALLFVISARSGVILLVLLNLGPTFIPLLLIVSVSSIFVQILGFLMLNLLLCVKLAVNTRAPHKKC